MYGQTHGVIRFVENSQPVVHVGALLLGNTHYPVVMDRSVGVTCDFYLIAVDLQQITKPKQYVKIYAFLGYALRRGTAAVNAAMG